MNWLVIWILIYLGVIVFFIFLHLKKSTKEHYFVNNRETKLFPLIATSLATYVGGGVSIGLISMGYEGGFAAVAIGIAYVIGFIIFSRFAPKINSYCREKNIYTFNGFLNEKYLKAATPKFSKLFSSYINIINIFIYFFLLAVQFVAMASILKYELGIGFEVALLISCVVVITYTTLAGMSGVISTDTLQFIILLLIIAVILIPGFLTDTNMLKDLGNLPNKMLNGTSYGIVFLIALPLFLAPSVLVRLDTWQRAISAKDGNVARKAIFYSGLGMLPFYFIFPLVGMSVKLLHNNINPNDATYIFLNSHCNEFLLGFAVVGFLAALMSSADSFLNIISISVVKDFIGWKKGKEKKELNKVKLFSVIFGILAMFVAYFFPNIVDLMVIGTSAIVVFVPTTILALIKKDLSNYKFAALHSIIWGFIANVAFFIYGIISPSTFQAKASFVPAFIVSAIVFFSIYLFNKKSINEN